MKAVSQRVPAPTVRLIPIHDGHALHLAVAIKTCHRPCIGRVLRSIRPLPPASFWPARHCRPPASDNPNRPLCALRGIGLARAGSQPPRMSPALLSAAMEPGRVSPLPLHLPHEGPPLRSSKPTREEHGCHSVGKLLRRLSLPGLQSAEAKECRWLLCPPQHRGLACRRVPALVRWGEDMRLSV